MLGLGDKNPPVALLMLVRLISVMALHMICVEIVTRGLYEGFYVVGVCKPSSLSFLLPRGTALASEKLATRQGMLDTLMPCLSLLPKQTRWSSLLPLLLYCALPCGFPSSLSIRGGLLFGKLCHSNICKCKAPSTLLMLGLFECFVHTSTLRKAISLTLIGPQSGSSCSVILIFRSTFAEL